MLRRPEQDLSLLLAPSPAALSILHGAVDPDDHRFQRHRRSSQFQGLPDHRLRTGRLFLAFITAISHSLLENRLRKYDLLNTKYTVPSALALLRKIKVTVGADGTRIPNEIPQKVQTLLNEMKVELKNV